MSKPIRNLVYMLAISIAVTAYSLVRNSDTFTIAGAVLIIITLGLLLNEYLLRKGLKVGMKFYNGEVEHEVEDYHYSETSLLIAGYVIELTSIDDNGLAIYKVVENLNVGTKNKPHSKDVRNKWVAYNIYTRMIRLPNGHILDPKK